MAKDLTHLIIMTILSTVKSHTRKATVKKFVKNP